MGRPDRAEIVWWLRCPYCSVDVGDHKENVLAPPDADGHQQRWHGACAKLWEKRRGKPAVWPPWETKAKPEKRKKEEPMQGNGSPTEQAPGALGRSEFGGLPDGLVVPPGHVVVPRYEEKMSVRETLAGLEALESRIRGRVEQVMAEVETAVTLLRGLEKALRKVQGRVAGLEETRLQETRATAIPARVTRRRRVRQTPVAGWDWTGRRIGGNPAPMALGILRVLQLQKRVWSREQIQQMLRRQLGYRTACAPDAISATINSANNRRQFPALRKIQRVAPGLYFWAGPR